jgi:plastocyanin
MTIMTIMTMRPLRRLMMTAAALLMASTALAADTQTVTQKGLAFIPNELAIDKGATVEFVNDDSTTHNVIVSGDGVSFNGGIQGPGGHVKYTFAKTGTFTVSCGIHPKMKLTVTVK